MNKPRFLVFLTLFAFGVVLTGCGGDDGADGEPGAQGDPGAAGEKGDPGAAGEKGDKGEPGDPGVAGQNGANGDPGADGATWSQGAGAPAADVGNEGELYLDTGTGDVYQKGASGWEQIANINGEDANPTCQGNTAPVIDAINYETPTCYKIGAPLSVEASDADGDDLTYSFSPSSFMQLDAIDGNPAARNLHTRAPGGPLYLTVTVSDSCDTVVQQVTITPSDGCYFGNTVIDDSGPSFQEGMGVASYDLGYGTVVIGTTKFEGSDWTGADCHADFTCGGFNNIFIATANYNRTGFSSRIRLGDDADETATDVVVDEDFNLYLIGYLEWGDLQGQTNAGGKDIFVIKAHFDGDLVIDWTQLFGTTDDDVAGEAIFSAETDGDYIYVAGSTTGDMETGVTNAGSKDAVLLKISALDGSLAWAKQWGTANSEDAHAVAIDSNGDLFVVSENSEEGNYSVTLNKFASDGTADATFGEVIWEDQMTPDVDVNSLNQLVVSMSKISNNDASTAAVHLVSGTDGSEIAAVALDNYEDLNSVAVATDDSIAICGQSKEKEAQLNMIPADLAGGPTATAIASSVGDDKCNDVYVIDSENDGGDVAVTTGIYNFVPDTGAIDYFLANYIL